MIPERWKQISHIYHEALGLKPNQRAAFLNKACAHDEELLHQINMLIESHEEADKFLESPAVEVAAKAIAADQSKKPADESSTRVLITIVKGSREGKTLAFSGRKICVFGRANDCYEILPDDDQISRHHFMLEVNAPDITIRDLGSLNGTSVNGQRKDRSKIVHLTHGDRIEVGEMILEVAVEVPIPCAVCGKNTRLCSPLKEGTSKTAVLCDSCSTVAFDAARRKEPGKPAAAAKITCSICKKEVRAEAGPFPQGNYICESCRTPVAEDKKAMKKFLDTTSHSWKRGGAPPIKGFELKKILGHGRLGTSYLAKEKKSKRQVVVKVVFLKDNPSGALQTELLSRFDEFRSLRHPNLVDLIDYGAAGNAFYIVSDYCNAGNVGQLMARKGRLSSNEAVPIMLQALEGLAFAHNKAVFHGDLKPENILLSGEEGRWVARISDLGVSCHLQQLGIGNMILKENAEDFPFTPSELLTGSGRPGPASDVWSISAIFYFMLTGKPPHDSPPKVDSLGALIESAIVPIGERCSDIPADFAQLIDDSLRPGTGRFNTAEEMLEAMRKVNNKVIRLTLAY